MADISQITPSRFHPGLLLFMWQLIGCVVEPADIPAKSSRGNLIKIGLLNGKHSTNLQYGQTYKFRCETLAGLRPQELSWEYTPCDNVDDCVKKWQRIENAVSKSFYNEMTEINITASETGRIRCVATRKNKIPYRSQDLEIIPSDVYDTETNEGVIIRGKECAEIFSGSSYTLTCQVQKNQFKMVEWGRKVNEKPVWLVTQINNDSFYNNSINLKAYFDPHSSNFSNTFTLSFHNISHSDTGEYYCHARHKNRETVVRHVHITVKDRIDHTKPNLFNSDTIQCKVSGWTPDNVVWSENGVEINFNNSPHLRLTSMGLQVSKDPKFNHYKYTCESRANLNGQCKYDRQTFTAITQPNNDQLIIFSIGSIFLVLIAIIVIIGILYGRNIHASRHAMRDEFDPTLPIYDILSNNHLIKPGYSNYLTVDSLIMDRRNIVIIGEGHFGYVIEVGLKKPNGTVKTVALKRPKNNFNPKQFEVLYKEMCLMTHLGEHPNIVNLLGIVNNADRGQLYIVIELCPNGSLLHHLRSALDNPNKFTSEIESSTSTDFFSCYSEEVYPRWHQSKLEQRSLCRKMIFTTDLLSYAYQIASAFEYLTSIGLVHRDISARNILLCCNFQIAKVSDFGLSFFLTQPDAYKYSYSYPDLGDIDDNQKAFKQSKWWAPESLVNGLFSIQSDVWSFGILLGEIFSLGEPPFSGEDFNPRLLSYGQLKPSKPKFAPTNIHNIILSCCKPEPENRICFSDAKKELMKEFCRCDRDEYQRLLFKQTIMSISEKQTAEQCPVYYSLPSPELFQLPIFQTLEYFRQGAQTDESVKQAEEEKYENIS